MKIKKVIETPEGKFEFEGELNGPEFDLVVEAGINYLLQQGVIPFKIVKNKASYVPPQEGQAQQ